MARQRTTFGKLQRATEKRERAQAKLEKRAARAQQGPEDAPEPAADQEAVLKEFADLHVAYEDGRIPEDEFQSRKALLTAQMKID